MRPFRIGPSHVDEEPPAAAFIGREDPDEPEEPPGGHPSTAAELTIPTRPARRRPVHRRHFGHVPTRAWNDWRWQLANRIHTREDLERVIPLEPDERAAFEMHGAALPVAITPYSLTLIDPDDPDPALRRTVIPTVAEFARLPGEDDDPLGEEGNSPIPGLVHRYPDRVLVLTTSRCAAYCRYCTRSRRVGDHGHPSAKLEAVLGYVAAHPEVRDVILSGGDPLTLPDHTLEVWLRGLRAIRHVEIIRIGTRTPAVLPMRITAELTRMLRRYHPLFMSIHATHPAELTGEMERACGRLADAGIPLGSQTVLLAGINDSVDTMRELMHRLLRARVRPYYLYQCDPIVGSGHFRTPVAKGLEIVAGLRGYTSGYAVPTYVIDAPGGGGKIPLVPDPVVSRDAAGLTLRNYEGKLYRYPAGGDR